MVKLGEGVEGEADADLNEGREFRSGYVVASDLCVVWLELERDEATAGG